jgi:hypothetical protein
MHAAIQHAQEDDHVEEILVCGHMLPSYGPLDALNMLREAAGLQPLWNTMTRAERACFEPVEPRCRICRDPDVRHLVNGLLDWQGVPVLVEGGKTHQITLSDIMRAIEPLNQGRDPRDRLTYGSLWVHSRRHYDVEGVAGYWSARMHKELRNALTGSRTATPMA